MGTLLATRVATNKAADFAQVVADKETCELLHYTERPQTCAVPSDRATAGGPAAAAAAMLHAAGQ